MKQIIKGRTPSEESKPIIKNSTFPSLTDRLKKRGLLFDFYWNSKSVRDHHKKNAMEAKRQLENIEQWERPHAFYQNFHDFLVVVYELYNKLSEHEPLEERDDLIDYLNEIKHKDEDTGKIAYIDMLTGEMFNDDFRRDLTQHHKVYSWKKFYKFWNQEIETLIRYHEICFIHTTKSLPGESQWMRKNVFTAK